MAHNLHLVVIKSDSAESACDIVENETFDFGDDNNWFTVVGAVSQDDEVHVKEDETSFMENLETIEKINAHIRKELASLTNENGYSRGRDLLNILIAGNKKIEDLDGQDWYSIKEFAHDMSNKFNFEGEDKSTTFDVLKGDQYKFGHYDEFGVTQHYSMLEDGASAEDEKTYVVFIDMHS